MGSSPSRPSSSEGFFAGVQAVLQAAEQARVQQEQARVQQEQARIQQEQAERAAREEAERWARQIEEDRRRAQAAREEAERIAQAAREQAERNRLAQLEAERIARVAQQEAEARTRVARAEAERIAREIEAQRERDRIAREAAERAAQAAREEAERQRRAAEEEAARARQAIEEENRRAQAAQEEARRARAAQEDAERQLKQGIQPVVMPTITEITAAKNRVQYTKGLFHVAVAGIAGSGKSSLINGVRGLRSKDAGAALTGVTETTLSLGRYPDPDAAKRVVWYDVPGAGTLKIRDWQYFNAEGLYVFDCIIVLIDARFTMTDIAILANCRRFKIPTYIVRSKSDQHIRNLMKEMGYDSDDDEEDSKASRAQLYEAARQQFIAETRRSVTLNLEQANLPQQRIYLLCNDALFGASRGLEPRKAIDEAELLADLRSEARAVTGQL